MSTKYQYQRYILSDTRIGTADFYDDIREHPRHYENANTIISEASDQGIYNVGRSICNYPTPTYNSEDKDLYEETEYSSIKSSNEYVANF